MSVLNEWKDGLSAFEEVIFRLNVRTNTIDRMHVKSSNAVGWPKS